MHETSGKTFRRQGDGLGWPTGLASCSVASVSSVRPGEPLQSGGPTAAETLRVLVVVVAAYVGVSIIANVMSVRVVTIFGFSIDAGTLIYPFAFTLRDLVHKVGGRDVARTTVLVTAAMNVVLAFSLWAAAALPADMAVGPQSEFGAVLVGTWRIVVASIVAQVISELLDTEIYSLYVARFGPRRQFGRVLSSNAVSVPVDSVIFAAIAFGGVFPADVVWSIIWANIVVKGATSLLSFPLIYSVRGPDER